MESSAGRGLLRGGALLGLGLTGWSCDAAPIPEIRIGILSYITGERRETSGRGTSEAALALVRQVPA